MTFLKVLLLALMLVAAAATSALYPIPPPDLPPSAINGDPKRTCDPIYFLEKLVV